MARAAPAADRAVSIISFLTANRSRGFTLSELVRHLGMNIASAHATLAVLCDFGFLLRDPVHRTYVLGPALAVSGFAALEQHPAIDAALEQAELLAIELDAEASVSAIAGRDLVLIDRRGAPTVRGGTLIGYAGDRTPLLAPFGAVFMAWADQPAVDVWLERADAGRQLAGHYRAVLADIRQQGFSIPLEAIADPAVTEAMRHVRTEPGSETAEQQLAGVLQQSGEMLLSAAALAPTDLVTCKTIAAPVFDALGQVLLSLSVTGPGRPEPLEQVQERGRRIARAALVATSSGRGRLPAEATQAR